MTKSIVNFILLSSNVITKIKNIKKNLVSAKTLLLLDRGFYHFQFWQRLIAQGIHFITRIKINAAIEYQQVFTDSYTLRDRLVKIGSGTKKTPFVTLRLIEIRVGKVWRSYLTSVLDPQILPPNITPICCHRFVSNSTSKGKFR